MSLTRRKFLAGSAAAGTSLFLYAYVGGTRVALAQIPGGSQDPASIPKYMTPMLIPPAMPRAGKVKQKMDKNVDYYEIAVRQFPQQILPAGFPATMVWGYGPVSAQNGPTIFNAPSLTIEAKHDKPVRVKWINDLVDANGKFLPHLLPVDPTLHWANPPQGSDPAYGSGPRDSRPFFTGTPGRYTGPVPLVTHVHGAVGVGDESDGYTEAWFLPAAIDVPSGYATVGTWYDFFAGKAAASYGATWGPGFATFQYPNLNRASTLWYHDHALGMTRLNVYAGPAGFFIVRGGPDDVVLDARTGGPAALPGPAPALGDLPGTTYYEIPIAIQDRSFNSDGSLFYPDTRAFFDEIVDDSYHPSGEFSPIWNPEFFGNTIIANGNTWPYQVVEQRQYRFRFLNGCQSRFLILDFNQIPGVAVTQIGNEGGFLAGPVDVTAAGNRILMGLAERADVIVDFTGVPLGEHILANVGPDEPFGGGVPGIDFDEADPATTGQIMSFRVVPAIAPDPSTPARHLQLPGIVPLPPASVTRPLALIEVSGVGVNENGDLVEGPIEALLGTVGPTAPDDTTPAGVWTERLWMDPVTENPALGATEIWEFYNTTADAHPMHVHEVTFEVVNREGLVIGADGEVFSPATPDGSITPPEPWESGFKDTVIAYPGQVTRVKAQFNTPGQYVYHCHIVEHEDNEMMRPFRIGPVQPGAPG